MIGLENTHRTVHIGYMHYIYSLFLGELSEKKLLRVLTFIRLIRFLQTLSKQSYLFRFHMRSSFL